MDPAVRDAAQRLRSLRQRAFGRHNAKITHATLLQSRHGARRDCEEDLFAVAGARNESLASGQGDGNLSVMGNVVGSGNVGVERGGGASAGGLEGAEDGGWADFESAFGTASAVNEPQVHVTTNSKEAIGKVQGDSGMRVGSVQGGLDGGLLIDFGDISVGGVDSGGGKVAGSRTRGGHSSGGGEGSQEKDLIDFG